MRSWQTLLPDFTNKIYVFHKGSPVSAICRYGAVFSYHSEGCNPEESQTRRIFFRRFFVYAQNNTVVILTTVRRKNLLPSISIHPSRYNVILKGFALKNLHPNESIVRSLTYVRDDKRCHSDDRKEEESLLK